MIPEPFIVKIELCPEFGVEVEFLVVLVGILSFLLGLDQVFYDVPGVAALGLYLRQSLSN